MESKVKTTKNKNTSLAALFNFENWELESQLSNKLPES